MARKSRVPTPPRKVQAPQRRRAPVEPADARRQRLLLYGLAGSGFLALGIVVLAVLLTRGGSGTDVAAAMRAAGCTFNTYPGQARTHIQNVNAKPKQWNSFPPTSGPHFGTPAIWGSYADPLKQTQVVHNLEHGGVAIQYGPKVPQPVVAQLQSFYNEDPRGLLLAPLPGLGDKVALGAWYDKRGGGTGQGELAKCTAFSQNAYEAFLDAYRFKGPERFPADSLQPGS